MWKADVVESWIADKENHVRSEDFGRDLSSVQTLLTKQETFDAGKITISLLILSLAIANIYCFFFKKGLHAFEQEGIQNITTLKDQLVVSECRS